MTFESKQKNMSIVLEVLPHHGFMHRVMRKWRGICNVNQYVVDQLIFTKLKELESQRYFERQTVYKKLCIEVF